MKIFLFILLFPVLLFAQKVISVDENLSKNTNKNLIAALAFSAAMPGSGHYYLGEKSRGVTLIWTEIALWFGAGTIYTYGDKQLSSARGFAVRYAGAYGAPKNVDFLSVMGNYRSRGGSQYQNSNPDDNEDYNMAMLRAGLAIDHKYPYTEGYIWDWGSSDNPETTKRMKEYNRMLKNYRISKIAFQISLGAMALNRVFAVLDAMRIYRKTSAEFSNLEIVPFVSPAHSGMFVNVFL